MRDIVQHACQAVVVVVVGVVGRPAGAQGLIVQGEGAVNVGYTQTTQAAAAIDPTAQASDQPVTSTGSFLTELRPSILLQFGSPRLTWRAGYTFSAALSPGAGQSVAYSNQANLAAAAELSKFSLMTVSGSAAQGGTSFLLSQQPAETGQPAIRAPGNPALVSASATEALSWQASERWMVQQTIIGSLSAPENDLHDRNSQLAGTLALDHQWGRDNVGLEARASVAWLRPLQAELKPYKSTTNDLLGRWNHDFTPRWNAFARAGIEQLYMGTGNRPLALLPTGSAIVRYSAGRVVGGLDFTHGSATNLQVGSVSLADQVTGRGIFTIDPEKARVLSFSAGFLHNEPIGEARIAAGTGNAVQGDAGFTTMLTKNSVATVRYSLAYQFGQDGGVGSSLIHVFLVGVIARYSNTSKVIRPVPTRGDRVDGSDGQGFLPSDPSRIPDDAEKTR